MVLFVGLLGCLTCQMTPQGGSERERARPRSQGKTGSQRTGRGQACPPGTASLKTPSIPPPEGSTPHSDLPRGLASYRTPTSHIPTLGTKLPTHIPLQHKSHPSHCRLLHLVALANNTAVNPGGGVTAWVLLSVLRSTPRSVMAGSCENSVFTFLQELPSCFPQKLPHSSLSPTVCGVRVSTCPSQ